MCEFLCGKIRYFLFGLSHVLWTYCWKYSIHIVNNNNRSCASFFTLYFVRFFEQRPFTFDDWKIGLTILTDFNWCRYNSTVGVSLSLSLRPSRYSACKMFRNWNSSDRAIRRQQWGSSSFTRKIQKRGRGE